MDNYRLQVEAAKRYFLGYDQDALVQKLGLEQDAHYLYATMLYKKYRIHRETGNVERLEENWVRTDDHSEVMTLLDLVCDSREDRRLSHRWANMLSFGGMFHRDLMENGRDALAQAIQANPEAFCRVCGEMQAGKAPGGDLGFTFALFDGLEIALQFWAGDEEFDPRLRFLWDENARMYLKYETMWFALGMLRRRILEGMGQNF